MTRHETSEQRTPREGGAEPRAKEIWAHSLAAAAICLGTAAVVALIAILGQLG